ncbi:protein SERAC1-like [Photinus pyralis]|nr:protein SERAC1-like [Photinus pyralis]
MSELRNRIKSASDILPLCLESLLHHCSLGNNGHDIIRLDGLPLLMEIYNRFQNDLDTKVKLCNVLAFVSVYPNVVEDFYKTGWITVLSKWLNDNDIRLSSTAAKILSNLDDNRAMYQNSLHILHPLYHCDQKALVDVIFVHGLLGGVFFTWRQRRANVFSGLFSTSIFRRTVTDVQSKLLRTSDPLVREYIQDAEVKDQYEWDQVGQDFEFVLNDIPTATNVEAEGPYTCCGNNDCIAQAAEDCCTHTSCWPRDWLPNDCSDLRILGINYDTSLSLWAKICPNEQKKCTIDERSDEFLTSLLQAGVGDRPIIWITHSMGGLIVKNLLWKAWESNSKRARKLCLNSKGIVFYSTPHIGSRIANLNATASLLLWPSVEIQELREDSQGLYKIQENFLQFIKQVPLKVLSFVETKSTLVTAIKFNVLFVDSHSGNPSIGEYFEVPQDHLGICKPANRMSFLYQKVLHFIQEIVEETKVKDQINIGLEQ